MGFLGLDRTEVKEDNFFQRMFWPADHAGEADTLGQQGFWVCCIVGILASLVMLLSGHAILAAIAAAFYLLGGIGVREHSQPAAILVAAAYSLGVVSSIFLTLDPPGALPVIAALLLIANIRGTFIAAKWADFGDAGALPDRLNETFTDKLVDQMPQRVWPKAKMPFFLLATLYVFFTLVGTVMLGVSAPARAARSHAAADKAWGATR